MSSKLSALPTLAVPPKYIYGIDGSNNQGKVNYSVIDLRNFGVVGNDIADDTTKIQAAIDYALQNNIAFVYCPPGFVCKTTDTIHLGYGVPSQQLTCVSLVGDKATYEPNRSAFFIKAYFVDRPIINIQGARGSGIYNIRIETNVTSVQVAAPHTHTLAWRADAANYVPTGAKDTATAPLCGVCIDGYSGAAPASPYPTPTYPAFLGAQTGAYNRSFSSGFFVQNCVIQNCLVGICVHPNADGNGDFANFYGNQIYYCKVAVSFGNSQARVNEFSRIDAFGVHTIFDGLTYTAGANGDLAGNYNNVHANAFYRIFNIGLNWSDPIHFENFYSERGMRIGDFVSAGNIMFSGCIFDVSDTWLDFPNTEIWNEPIATNLGRASFKHCMFTYQRAAFYFRDSDVSFESCSFRNAHWETPVAGDELTAMKDHGNLFVNYTPNLPEVPPGRVSRCNFTVYPTVFNMSGYDEATINTWHNVGYCDYIVRNYDVQQQYTRSHSVSITSLSFSGRVLSGTAAIGSYYKTGDVFYGTGNGAPNNWYFCTAYNSGTGAISLQAIGNYKWNGTTFTMHNTTLPSTFYYFPTGAMHPPVDVNKFMVTVAASATVQVVDGTGASVARPAAITTNSKPFWFMQPDRLARSLPFPGSATVVNTASPNSFDMSANAVVSGTWAMAPGICKIK